MNIFLALSFFAFSLSTFALTVDEAFRDFYESSEISERHCGRNIHHFLNYLKRKRVRYNSGYVVSLHDDVGSLNHFDARWGSEEEYKEGGSYYRSNWYFHVFAVIDGKAYDFSQRETKTSSFAKYLSDAYLPKGTTERIFFLGRFTADKAYQKYKKTRMKLHSLTNYAENYSGNFYEGNLIEAFNYFDSKPSKSYGQRYSDLDLSYKSIKKVKGGYKVLEPEVSYNGVKYPLKAEPYKICQAFGYMGAVNNSLEYVVSNNVSMLNISSYFKKSSSRYISSKDIRLSLSIKKSDSSIPNQPLLHYAKSVVCTDFNTLQN